MRFPKQWDNFKSGIDGPIGAQALKSLSVNASVKNSGSFTYVDAFTLFKSTAKRKVKRNTIL